jgi:hypothetical protein
MKKPMIIIWFAIVTISGFTQNYHKLIRTNTYWDVFALGFLYYDAIDRIYFTGNDTVIEGKVYNLSRQYPFEQVNPGWLIPPFVIDTVSIPTNFFIREDTIERKVYIYDPYLTPTDQLLYDFSLSVGDTLQSDYNVGPLGSPIVLMTIDSITLQNGEKRKEFIFYAFDTNNITANYIEGIGGQQGLFAPIFPAFEQNEFYGYFCINENEINLWGDQCIWYFVGMSNQNENQTIKVFPNPAQDILNVNLSQKIPFADLTVSNIQGKEIFREKLNHSSNKITISQINPGIYIYQITSGQFIKQGKIVVL